MENRNFKLKVLEEHYREVSEGTTFREYVKMEAESDPGFFRWLLGDSDIDDFGDNMTEEQKNEFSEFLEKL